LFIYLFIFWCCQANVSSMTSASLSPEYSQALEVCLAHSRYTVNMFLMNAGRNVPTYMLILKLYPGSGVILNLTSKKIHQDWTITSMTITLEDRHWAHEHITQD
jgi:glucose-6-phosphate 1-dehydrogenase